MMRTVLLLALGIVTMGAQEKSDDTTKAQTVKPVKPSESKKKYSKAKSSEKNSAKGVRTWQDESLKSLSKSHTADSSPAANRADTATSETGGEEGGKRKVSSK